jgi:hypothetical protein
MWRSIGLVLITFVVGAVLDFGTAYVAGTTPQGQMFLRDFLVAQEQKAAAAEPAATSSAQMLYPQRLLPVPQSYANYAYFIAINNVVADIALINNANVELGPVLVTLDQKTLSCSYDGFYDLMDNARTLANKNQALAAQFVMHLNDLAAANTQTTDAITKSETAAAVSAGQALGASLAQYATTVQNILYGDTPTSAQIAALQSQANAVQGASQTFADALKPLVAHIGDADQALIKAAATSTLLH